MFIPSKHLLLAATALVLAACGSKEDRIESGLKKGAEFVHQADWDKANVELRNVLQIDPKNARAYLLAAQVSESQNDPKKAYGQYLKAVELKPELLDAKVGAAKLLLVTGDRARAEALVSEVLAADPRHALARTLKAALLAGSGQPVQVAQAQALAQEVLADTKPAPVDTSLLLAGLHANAKEWAAGLAVVEAALQQNPQNMGLLQAAVDLSSANPQDAATSGKATVFFERATSAAPRNHSLWLAWARYHLGRKEADKAEAVMRAALKAQPDDGKRRMALLEFMLAVRGPQAAEQEYLAVIKEKPRDMATRFGLANLYRSTNRPEQAQKLLAEIIDLADDTPSQMTARNQLAGDRLAAGRVAEARALVEQVLKTNPRDATALLLRGRMLLAAGQPQAAVADLRGALRDQPGAADVVRLLAQAHRAAGEPALARDALAEAVKQRPEDAQLRLLLAADMAAAKDVISAHAELDSALRVLPKAAALYQAKAQLAATQKDYALAQKTLQLYKAQLPADSAPYLRQGQIYTEQGRHDLALKEYDAGAVAAPADPTPYVASVSLLTGLKRHDEAMARVQARLRAEPNNRAMHLQLQGELLAARGDLAGAEQAYRQAVAAAPTLGNGHLGLARVLASQGKADDALKTLEAGELAAPAERLLPLKRAEALARLRRHDDAIRLYEQLAQRYPEDDTVANNLAYLLAEVKGDPASTQRALVLATRFADSRNAGHLDSLGWIHYRLGQYDKAVPLLEKAVALAPPTPLLQLHLGKALVKTGDRARGQTLIRQAIERQPDLPRLDEARALLAQG